MQHILNATKLILILIGWCLNPQIYIYTVKYRKSKYVGVSYRYYLYTSITYPTVVEQKSSVSENIKT